VAARIAGYGPVCPVVWQGSAGDCCPYADQSFFCCRQQKKETPTLRVIERRPRGTAKVVGMPRVGGLHHRYRWQTAA
jgi:hypothetical protein